MKTYLKVAAVAVCSVAVVSGLAVLNYKISAVSATQDNILRTLQDEGLIQGLKIGK